MTDNTTFTRSKLRLNVGVLGHVDHGKTTLTAAITLVLGAQGRAKVVSYDEIDRAPEERSNGLTINRAYVEYETASRHYTHIDCPTSANYVKNVITAAAQLDGAILVVSATDGPMAQTHEHIVLSHQVGVRYLVVYLNKCDQVADEGKLALIEAEVRALLTANGFDGNRIVIIRGSALFSLNGEDNDQGYGVSSINRLMDALDSVIPDPVRALDAPFLMPVEDVMSITGRGTVVTGVVESGVIKVGDAVEIVGLRPSALKTTITGVEMFKKQLQRGEAGDNAGLLLRGTKKEEVERGMVIAQPGIIQAHNRFKGVAYLLKPEEGGRTTPVQAKYKPQFYFRTTDVTGELVEVRDGADQEVLELVMPGDHVNMTVYLAQRVAMAVGLHFIIRERSRTIGVGVITEILA
ncbi:MAG: elongation factor Tu [Caldilineaceae bacterium]|nr:elongation factor Tu [Caldilineaceae bacterium]